MRTLAETKHIAPTHHLAHGLNPVVTYLEKSGINPRSLLAQAKVGESVRYDPTHQLSTEQELCFLTLAIDAIKQPDLGLQLGSKYHLSAYGTLGLAIMTSKNMLEASNVLFKHILMTWTYMHWSVSVHRGAAILVEQPLRDLGNCSQYMIDRGLIATYLIYGEALGRPLQLREINLTQEKPGYADRYEELFKCQVNFGQRTNCYSFDEAYLYEPLPQADPDSNLIFRSQCEKICKQLGGKLSFSDMVRQYILDSLAQNSHECTMELIASKLYLTPRTVQRKLASENTSFKNIQDEVRCTLAIEYLESTELVTEEIAALLGYKESSSFCHAFKRWTGKPPRKYRQKANA